MRPQHEQGRTDLERRCIQSHCWRKEWTHHQHRRRDEHQTWRTAQTGWNTWSGNCDVAKNVCGQDDMETRGESVGTWQPPAAPGYKYWVHEDQRMHGRGDQGVDFEGNIAEISWRTWRTTSLCSAYATDLKGTMPAKMFTYRFFVLRV